MSLTLSLLFVFISAAVPSNVNVLHLMADDLRPQLNSYGQSYMKTPNLDALALSGLKFEKAYTQFSYCAPSRNSFMTGRRPERTRCLNFLTDFRKLHGDSWVTMPQFFKNKGYFTTAAGKLFHDGMDDPLSWLYPSNQTAWIKNITGDVCDVHQNYCAITNASHIKFTDEDLVLEEGLARMRLAAASGKPWWVGIGVHRPHWPSRLPEGWLGPEVYPAGVLPPKHPLGIPDTPYMSGAYKDGDYHNPALGCPNCSAPTSDTVNYRMWYYAAVSYVDYMLGKALALLDELGARNNTIVMFHADHGYQLGELNEWSKKTNNELAVRVPLIIRAPWKQFSVGKSTEVHAELVDLYKTIVDLALPGSAGDIQSDVQGVSLAPVFDDPAAPLPPALNKSAFSQIGSCACKEYTVGNWTGLECDAGRCFETPVANFDFMGYTQLTPEGWRYTLWAHMDNATQRVDFTEPTFEELYDLRVDTGRDFDLDAYSENVARNHPALCASLKQSTIAEVKTWY